MSLEEELYSPLLDISIIYLEIRLNILGMSAKIAEAVQQRVLEETIICKHQG